MHANWLTYYRIARDLRELLTGAGIAEAYTQEKNVVVLGCTGRSGDVALQFSCHPQMPYIRLLDAVRRAGKNSVDLFPGIIGCRITDIAIARNDRQLRLSLDDGTWLLLQLYSARANLFHLDAPGGVITAFKQHVTGVRADGIAWIDPAEPIDEAVPRGHAPVAAGEAAIATLAAEYGFLKGTLKEALCERLAGAEETPPWAAFIGMLRECDRGVARIYARPDRVPVFSLVALADRGEPVEAPDTTVLAAHDRFLRMLLRATHFQQRRQAALKAVERELHRRRAALEALPDAAARAAEADGFERWAHLLMIHSGVYPVQPGLVVVPDTFTDPRLVVSIPVKEGDSNIRSAERYYDKARNIRGGIIFTEEKRRDTVRRIAELESMKKKIESITEPDELKNELRDLKLAGLAPAGAEGEKQGPALPYRAFEIGGYTVLVGKSSADNDEVTFRHARPNDIWMHARGVSGSHVVIRLDGRPKPGRDIIRRAAALAAYYSKYRNAGNVPVAFTERKFVHKMKGAPAGTVRMDREEVVMVKPGLAVDS